MTAKMHSGLLLEILSRYCPEPCTILDPMGGIGTLMLAAQYGHTVIINELESHFLETIPKSWAKIQRNGPALGHSMGSLLLVRADARHLPIASADHIVTSPPYEASDVTVPLDSTTQGKAVTGNLQRRYTRPVDAVISSPPYEGSIQGQPGIDWSKTQAEDGSIRDMTVEPGYEARIKRHSGYTRPAYEKVRAKVEGGEYTGKRPDVWTSPTNMAAHGYLDGYSGASENIGNQRGQAYWSSMSLCYAECLRCLRPGGIMALVLKGFTRNGEYVDLPQQTAALVESLGFVKFDEWRRELWSLSFWRILQRRRDPAAFDDRLNYETVLVFRKE